jgi:hypothetical protein
VAYGILHCARSDGPVAGCDAAGAVLLCKEEEHGDRVARDVLEIGTDSAGGTVLAPDVPRASCGVVTMRRVGGTQRCRDSEPITAERMLGCRVSSFQEAA